MEPRILLFDEPTSALDPEMIKEVPDVMTALAGEGRTMVCVTHELGFAREAADRILFMDQGGILEDASPADFFAAPKSARERTFPDQNITHFRATSPTRPDRDAPRPSLPRARKT